jgi:dihydrofolate reductase
VIMAFGSRTPFCTCSISRGSSLFTEAWFARMVMPLLTTFPIGTWVPTGPYTPTMETIPPFFTELIAQCNAVAKPSAVPSHLVDDVEWLSLPPQRLVGWLAARGATHLYVDGGKTIQGFLRAGLIDELTITRVPILIGTGVPLFGQLNHDIRLTHIATQQFENGFVQSNYRVEETA